MDSLTDLVLKPSNSIACPMTIEPAPMIRLEEMQVRLDIELFFEPLPHHVVGVAVY